MTPTWRSDEPPAPVDLSPGGWVRAGARAIPLGILLLCGLMLMLALRLAERPFHGAARPWSARIAAGVCRIACRVIGLRYHATGRLMAGPGAIVANHSSWLDIFVLNAGGPLTFVAKAEVAGWPGIGLLARAAGTVFVRRDAREARAQTALFETRFAAGDRLLFFPEGTSTDGRRVLDFKPTLFAALFAPSLRERLHVQPVTVVYTAPEGVDPRFYGWWGDMGFAPHLLAVLGQRKRGAVRVIWHEPIAVTDLPDRKALARAAEAAVRSAHPGGARASAERGE